MNKQFTPGPWVVGLEEPEQNQHGAYGIDIHAPQQNINSVATVWESAGGFTEEDYANARLIAEAPEMFKLLEAFYPVLQTTLQPADRVKLEALLDRITNPNH